MADRAVLNIYLKKIIFNLNKIKKQVFPAEIMVILKSNAYGIGIEKMAEICLLNGARTIGVAEFNEAKKVIPILKKINSQNNKNKEKKNLQIIGSIFKDEIEPCIRNDVIIPIENLKMAKDVNKVAKNINKKSQVHLLVDTGMGRLGIPYEKVDEVIQKILDLDYLWLNGIYSHFSSANSFDSKSKSYTKKQHQKVLEIKNKNLDFTYHLANSDGINNYPDSYLNMVRTGINLYGVFDLKNNPIYQLKSAISFETKIIALKKKKKADFIGYDRTYQLKKDQWIATIPVGYADGIPLALSNIGKVLINGDYYPIVGKVSMDYTTINIFDNSKKIKVNAKVILIGEQKKNRITVEDWAKIKKTHPYDILCSIGNRVKRIYK